jgi:hypothetical protein
MCVVPTYKHPPRTQALKPDVLVAPDVDSTLYVGMSYFLLGQSTQVCACVRGGRGYWVCPSAPVVAWRRVLRMPGGSALTAPVHQPCHSWPLTVEIHAPVCVQAQADASSMSHGVVSATQMDACQHVRGDIRSGAGDSGGGVFATNSGKLIAVCVGVDDIAKKAVFAPMAAVEHFTHSLRSL